MPLREIVSFTIPSRRALAEALLLDRTRYERSVEWLWVVAIVAVVLAFALRDARLLLPKMRAAEALLLTSPLRADVAAARAVTGRLPDELPNAGNTLRLGRVTNVEWLDGELVVTLPGGEGGDSNADATTLSMRLASTPYGGTTWLCGGREPPDGFTAPLTRHTTLPPRDSFHFCRATGWRP